MVVQFDENKIKEAIQSKPRSLSFVLPMQTSVSPPHLAKRKAAKVQWSPELKPTSQPRSTSLDDKVQLRGRSSKDRDADDAALDQV